MVGCRDQLVLWPAQDKARIWVPLLILPPTNLDCGLHLSLVSPCPPYTGASFEFHPGNSWSCEPTFTLLDFIITCNVFSYFSCLSFNEHFPSKFFNLYFSIICGCSFLKHVLSVYSFFPSRTLIIWISSRFLYCLIFLSHFSSFYPFLISYGTGEFLDPRAQLSNSLFSFTHPAIQ